jgi:hypothetical protein
MAMFRSEIGPFLIERRRTSRTRGTCAASVQTSAGEIFGQLCDLSQTGARIQAGDPPEQGTPALLKWASERVPCHVVWVRGDICALGFDSPIDRAVVSASARVIGGPEQSAASLSNIPIGQKRSARS